MSATLGTTTVMDAPVLAAVGLTSLHPDLRPYVVRMRKGGYGLSAPLMDVFLIQEGEGVWSVPWINEFYLKNKQHAEELLAAHDWTGYILFTRRPFRLRAFTEIHSRLTDAEYWELLRDVWTGSETIWRNNTLWLMVLLGRPSRHLFMTPEDRAAFDALPDSFTIYRGYQPGKNRDGFSWTLNTAVAEKLCNNGKGTNLFDCAVTLTGGKVRQKTVNKSDVFACTNSRDEQEIILLWNGKQYLTP